MGRKSHQVYDPDKSPKPLLPVVLAFLLFYFVPLPLTFAQKDLAPADFYSYNDGLSDRQVTDIIQTQDQMIWIGTSNGLNKFDGYEFTVFNNFPGNKNQISHDDILELAEDKEGRLVILYRNQPNIFDLLDPITHQLEKVELTLSNGVSGIARDIHVNRNGEIYILTIQRTGLQIYHFTGEGRVTKILELEERHKDLTAKASLLALQDGTFMINEAEYGVRLFDETGTLVKSFKSRDFLNTKKPFAYPNPAFFMHEDPQGKVWLSLFHTPTPFLLDQTALNFYPVDRLPKNKYYTRIWEDQAGNILLGTGKNRKTEAHTLDLFYVTLENDVQDYSHLLVYDDNITAAYGQDFSKILFLGVEDGFKIVRNSKSNVKTYLHDPTGQDAVIVRGISGDDHGQVFILAENEQIYAYDLRTQYLDTLPMIDSQTGRHINFTCASELQFDPAGYLWAMTCHFSNYGKLIKYDLETCETNSYPSTIGFKAMAQDEKGVIWIAGGEKEKEGTLLTFDPKQSEYRPYLTPDGLNPLEGLTPYYLLFDRAGDLWMGTDSGVLKMNTKTGAIERFSIDNASDEGRLSHNTCYVLVEDELGTIWIGTKNGLNALNPVTKSVEVFTQDNGMSSSTVHGILLDENQNLWISTFNGLTHYDRNNNLFRIFYEIDGFSNDEFTPYSFYKDEYGQCYFGTVNGLNAFYPEDILIDKEIPKVILTRVERFDSDSNKPIVQDTNLVDLKELTIQPGASFFTLHFALPIYYGRGKIRFRSILENYEFSWRDHKTGVIKYNNLPPGDYVLRVKGADSNGNWSTEEYKMSIHIEQYFYKKPIFWFFIFLGLVAIIYGILKNRLEQKLRMERLRMKLSSDLHDEVSGLLSGIAMQSDMLRMMSKDQELKPRLKTIGEASRKAMSKMSDVIWSIDSRKDRLEDLIERMHVHADEVLLPIDIRYDFKVGNMERQQKIPANIRQDVYFIYKEAINNIAKHSQATKVNIQMENLGPIFQLTISDNGAAIPVAVLENESRGKIINVRTRRKSGQGLTNMKMRAQRLKAEIKIAKDNGFQVQLQMRKFAK